MSNDEDGGMVTDEIADVVTVETVGGFLRHDLGLTMSSDIRATQWWVEHIEHILLEKIRIQS